MKARHHHDAIVLNSIVQAIREALDEESTGVAVVNRVGDRKGQHRFDRVVHGVDELVAETLPLYLVPFPGGLDIDQGIGEEPDSGHRNQL